MQQATMHPSETDNEENMNTALVASNGLLELTRAYNRKEITREEWLTQSRTWAEAVLRYYGHRVPAISD